MKTKEFMSYEVPVVEIIKVEVEQGFAGSTPGAGQDPEDEIG